MNANDLIGELSQEARSKDTIIFMQWVVEGGDIKCFQGFHYKQLASEGRSKEDSLRAWQGI